MARNNEPNAKETIVITVVWILIVVGMTTIFMPIRNMYDNPEWKLKAGVVYMIVSIIVGIIFVLTSKSFVKRYKERNKS